VLARERFNAAKPNFAVGGRVTLFSRQ
jgi:RNA polymerase sigma-70 factor, ECF subfamily